MGPTRRSNPAFVLEDVDDGDEAPPATASACAPAEMPNSLDEAPRTPATPPATPPASPACSPRRLLSEAMYCIRMDRGRALRALRDRHGPEALWRLVDARGSNLLHLCVFFNSYECAAVVLAPRRGAAAAAADGGAPGPRRLARQPGDDGRTPLHLCYERGDQARLGVVTPPDPRLFALVEAQVYDADERAAARGAVDASADAAMRASDRRDALGRKPSDRPARRSPRRTAKRAVAGCRDAPRADEGADRAEASGARRGRRFAPGRKPRRELAAPAMSVAPGDDAPARDAPDDAPGGDLASSDDSGSDGGGGSDGDGGFSFFCGADRVNLVCAPEGAAFADAGAAPSFVCAPDDDAFGAAAPLLFGADAPARARGEPDSVLGRLGLGFFFCACNGLDADPPGPPPPPGESATPPLDLVSAPRAPVETCDLDGDGAPRPADDDEQAPQVANLVF